MKLWQKILCTIGIVAVCTFALVMCLMPRRNNNLATCKQLVVVITDSTRISYVKGQDIHKYIVKGGYNPIGKTMSEINYHQIEQYVCSHSMVESAECFPTTKGQVYVNIVQRTPKYRVAGEKNYYVDHNRQIMPVTSTTAAYVPVATGRISERMAKEELFDFVCWIEDNEFWNAQIEQICINQQFEAELIPRVGSGKILLGKLTDDYAQRLDKLMHLYQDGFQKNGWKEYQEIDLRFDGQVICR